MEVITKQTYKCDHCSKIYQIKSWCKKHEEKCKKNPDNVRACFDCKYLERVKETCFFETFGGEYSKKVEVFKCNKLDKFLYPPLAEHKGNAYEFEDKSNDPMPMQCDSYEWMYGDQLDSMDFTDLMKDNH